MAKKVQGDHGPRRIGAAPSSRAQGLATEPIEEIAGRVRRLAPRAANDNEPQHRFASLAKPVALAAVSAALGGLIAALLLG
ncbi:MAG: hypothetical protein AB7P52_02755 [Alphaproteobacteria bacterium]